MSYHIQNLINILIHLNNISFHYESINNGSHITVTYENRAYSIICHDFSYGHEKGLLEIYNNHWNDVCGWLTAEEVFEIIEEDVTEDYI